MASTPSASHILALILLVVTPSLAFIPIQPVPSDLDTNIWIPIATITPSPTPPSSPSLHQHVEARNPDPQGAVVTAPAAAQPATVNPDQVSPITTYQANEYQGGVPVAVNVVYTQIFAAVPDQWPSASAGTIGLGTIQGVVGVVKTKRSLPTQEPMIIAAEDKKGFSVGEEMQMVDETVKSTVTGTGVGAVVTDMSSVIEAETQQEESWYEIIETDPVVEPALVAVNGAAMQSRKGGVLAASAVLAASLLVGAFTML